MVCAYRQNMDAGLDDPGGLFMGKFSRIYCMASQFGDTHVPRKYSSFVWNSCRRHDRI